MGRIGFAPTAALKLIAPTAATTGRPFTVRVTDGETGEPQSGATVGGATTDPAGNAQLSFPEAGIYRLKAERAESVRSNRVTVCVDPAGAEPCTSTDKTAPGVRVNVPGRLASDGGRSRTVLVKWLGEDGSGSGVTGYKLEARRCPPASSGRRRVASGPWWSARRSRSFTSAVRPAAPTGFA